MKLKTKINLLILICILYTTNSFSQDSTATNTPLLKLTFGGIAQDELSINNLLSDSLQFINSANFSSLELQGFSINDIKIYSFNLTIICNGIVLKYFENISGRRLTREMKESVKMLHPGCRIIFDKILIRSTTKDAKYVDYGYGATLKYVLK